MLSLSIALSLLLVTLPPSPPPPSLSFVFVHFFLCLSLSVCLSSPSSLSVCLSSPSYPPSFHLPPLLCLSLRLILRRTEHCHCWQSLSALSTIYVYDVSTDTRLFVCPPVSRSAVHPNIDRIEIPHSYVRLQRRGPFVFIMDRHHFFLCLLVSLSQLFALINSSSPFMRATPKAGQRSARVTAADKLSGPLPTSLVKGEALGVSTRKVSWVRRRPEIKLNEKGL